MAEPIHVPFPKATRTHIGFSNLFETNCVVGRRDLNGENMVCLVDKQTFDLIFAEEEEDKEGLYAARWVTNAFLNQNEKNQYKCGSDSSIEWLMVGYAIAFILTGLLTRNNLAAAVLTAILVTHFWFSNGTTFRRIQAVLVAFDVVPYWLINILQRNPKSHPSEEKVALASATLFVFLKAAEGTYQ